MWEHPDRFLSPVNSNHLNLSSRLWENVVHSNRSFSKSPSSITSLPDHHFLVSVSRYWALNLLSGLNIFGNLNQRFCNQLCPIWAIFILVSAKKTQFPVVYTSNICFLLCQLSSFSEVVFLTILLSQEHQSCPQENVRKTL